MTKWLNTYWVQIQNDNNCLPKHPVHGFLSEQDDFQSITFHFRHLFFCLQALLERRRTQYSLFANCSWVGFEVFNFVGVSNTESAWGLYDPSRDGAALVRVIARTSMARLNLKFSIEPSSEDKALGEFVLFIQTLSSCLQRPRFLSEDLFHGWNWVSEVSETTNQNMRWLCANLQFCFTRGLYRNNH